MFTYPKVLRQKDLKKISRYSCDKQIKEVYLKYLTNYSFEEFMEFCKENNDKKFPDVIFKFTDLQLDKFKPNSPIWISHVLINFMIYFHVNLDYREYYDAYASALQLTVLSCALKMLTDKIPFERVLFPQNSMVCFEKLFGQCPDFEFDLKKDCILAYKSFNEDFAFSSEDFYRKVRIHFHKMGYCE